MTSRDPYSVLGISKTASEDDIRAAYRRMALKTHPDKNPHVPGASAQFVEVSDAFTKLMHGGSDGEDSEDSYDSDEYEDCDDDDDEYYSDNEYFDRRDAFRLFARIFQEGFSFEGVSFDANGRASNYRNRVKANSAPKSGPKAARTGGKRRGAGRGEFDDECDCPKCRMNRDPESMREAFYENLYDKRQDRVYREESKNKDKKPAFQYAKKEEDINLDWLDEYEEKEKKGDKGSKKEGGKKKKVVLSKEGTFLL
jgi:curved DNA-binding protein CbpA